MTDLEPRLPIPGRQYRVTTYYQHPGNAEEVKSHRDFDDEDEAIRFAAKRKSREDVTRSLVTPIA